VTAEPVAVTDADWDARVLGGHTPVLVDFWAPWCVPCRKVEPVVRDLAARYAGRLTVARLNVDDEPRSAGRYEVLSLPTLILFRDGEPVERIAGAVKPVRLERAVAAHIDARGN
jgi:thioredoxin 1